MTVSNPVDKLIEISKQNQVLLGQVAATQEMLLQVELDRKKTEKNKFIWEIIKYGIFIILIFISFSFTQGLVESLTSKMLGGGGKNIDIEKMLEGSNNLLKTLQ